MKRLITLLLCLCMILPMVFALALGADATASTENDTSVITLDQSVYAPGEDIHLTVSAGTTQGWVGIVPANDEGEPTIDCGGLYWKYVRELDSSSITTGEKMKAANAETLAKRLGFSTKEELFAVPTGKYFAFYVSDESKGLPDGVKAGLATFVPFTVSQFSMEKTSFLYGEAIPVKILYKAENGGYIGLSRVLEDGTVRPNLMYTYTTDANLNTTIDIAKGTPYGVDKDAYSRLPAGRYVVYFVADNNGGANSRDQRSEVYIDIWGATVEMTEFKYGEPIMVTGYGAGMDWIGISQLDDSTKSGYWSNGSIRYRYISFASADPSKAGKGSGVAFDMREAYATSAGASRADLPAGEYVIFVGLDDCYAEDVSSYTHITITITAEKPDAPTSVSYVLDDKRTGLAGGKLTVTFDEASMDLNKKPTYVELYWADANGNELTGYNRIGSRKVTGAVTEIEMTDSMVIPEGAAKLMVCAYNGAGAAEAVAAELPADRGYRTTGAKVTSFQIVSDLHIGKGTESEAHANMMFEDIMELDPDSVGIFVAGDAADHGQEAEYARLLELWTAANQSGLVPELYIGVGNHEMMKSTADHSYSGDYSAQTERFLTYANQSLEEAEKTSTPYYYVNRGGQHFIFLATEYCGTHAYLSDAQLNWLSAKLAEVAADGAPVFIMLHQPLYDTVAGGLANEDGSKRQGWHGVIAGDANFEAWKALVAENGKGTSDHGLMYGQYEQPLRDILAQYPSAMIFSGHSHWIMESLGNIYEATEAQPNYMFNTASVSYLWTDNDELNSGIGTPEGGQGYFVTVYENCIELRGRDFVNGTWIPNAYYRIWLDCAHEYENDCTTACKWCGETRDEAPHSYENACDTECNECGATRTVGDHVYDNATCDADCNECGATREVSHAYENACDTVCNVCELPRTVGDHVYDNDICDTDCNECGAVREVPHSYENACDTECNECGATRTVGDHVYDNATCDTDCNVCGAVREAPHSYENACDTDCNVCGATRTVGDHVYDNATCDTDCNECGATREVSHAYENACDTECNECGATRTVGDHVYDNETCDTDCNVCGAVREVPHSYENACDADCNVCGAVREAPHGYENACDTDCNVCGATRTVGDHAYDNATCDADCNICGAIRTVEHVRIYQCDDTCNACKQAIEPLRAHCGFVPCTSTVCKYGCGTALTPVPHEGVYACSDSCRYNCGTLIDREEHTGLYPCSDACQYCGIPVTPGDHAYSETAKPHNATQHKRLCVCGEVAVYADHTWDEGRLTVAPSLEAEGERTFACTECGATRTEPVERLPEAATGTGSGGAAENNAEANGDQTNTKKDDGLGAGAAVAIVVIAVILLGGGCFAVYWFVIRKKKKTDH